MLAELERAMREAEEASRLAEQARQESEGVSTTDDSRTRPNTQTGDGEPEGYKFTALYYGIGQASATDVGKLASCSEYIAESQQRVINVLGKLPPVSVDAEPGDISDTEYRTGHVCPAGYVGACTYRGGRFFGGRTIGYEKWHVYQAGVYDSESLPFYQKICNEDGDQWHGSD